MPPDESLIAADQSSVTASSIQRPKNAIHKRGVQNACGLGQTSLDQPSSALPHYVSQHGRANDERFQYAIIRDVCNNLHQENQLIWV